MTRVPFLDSSAYSQPNEVKKFAKKVKGNFLLSLPQRIAKKLFTVRYMPHLNKKFWDHTARHCALAVAALSESIETKTIDRMAGIYNDLNLI